MKKQNFLAARRILLALTCAALLAIPTISAQAQSGGILDVIEHAKQGQAQALEGSWIDTITLLVPPGAPPIPPFRGYSTFARGGAYIGSDRAHPFSSPRHGAWVHTGGNEFATTLIEDQFDAQGNFQGTLTVRQKITVTGANTYVAVANGEVRNAAGNLTFNVCGTFRGERIKVEPLAPQCQSITPPQ